MIQFWAGFFVGALIMALVIIEVVYRAQDGFFSEYEE